MFQRTNNSILNSSSSSSSVFPVSLSRRGRREAEQQRRRRTEGLLLSISPANNNSSNHIYRRYSRARLHTTTKAAAEQIISMKPFEFQTAERTVFEIGCFRTRSAKLIKELLKSTRDGDGDNATALIVTGESDRFSRTLEDLLLKEQSVKSVTYHCPKGEPTVDSARECVEFAEKNSCTLVIAIGGGTAIDTGKCVAAILTNGGYERDIYDFLEVVGKAMPIKNMPCPFVAIPTTAGPGAELTKNSVLEAGDRKVSMRHPMMLPNLVIVDPELTISMPKDVTAHTGLDALTQCIEPYVCNSPNPIVDVMSMAGIKLGAKSLRRAIEEPDNIEARTNMALCAMYGGTSLANAKLGAVHGFSGTLGGLLHAPHGAICAALLPHCVKMNVDLLEGRVMRSDPDIAANALKRYKEVACACLDRDDATVDELIEWIEDLVSFCGVPKLSKFGLRDSHVSESVLKSMESSSMKGNPVALTKEELEQMLRNAM